MKEFKGTPGKWVVDTVETDGEVTEIYILREIGGCIMCVNDGDDNYDIPADLANAHLVAAAPELLSALQLLLAAYQSDGTDDLHNKDVEQTAKYAINKALKSLTIQV